MIQVRDPAVDADDEWTTFNTDDLAGAAEMFRGRRGIPAGHPVEAQNGDGAVHVIGYVPESPKPKRPGPPPQNKGRGRSSMDRQRILWHLRNGPMQANAILAAEFGAESLAMFLKMRAFLGELYDMARPAVIGSDVPPAPALLAKDGQRYSLPPKGESA